MYDTTRTAPPPRGGHHDHEDVDRLIARLEARDRKEWQRPDEVVRALRLRPGDVVADVGAGPGYFTLRLARAVGPLGQILAVDVDPEMIAALRERVDRAGVGNVTAVLAPREDAALPPAACDLVLVVNTFHHFRDGAAYLRRLASRLRRGGRIANVDFRAGELPVGPPPEQKVSRQDFLAAAARAGLRLVEEHEFLPHQYFLVVAP